MTWQEALTLLLLIALAIAGTGFVSSAALLNPRGAFALGWRMLQVWGFGVLFLAPFGFASYIGWLPESLKTVLVVVVGGLWAPLLPFGAGLMWRGNFPTLGAVAIGTANFYMVLFLWRVVVPLSK